MEDNLQSTAATKNQALQQLVDNCGAIACITAASEEMGFPCHMFCHRYLYRRLWFCPIYCYKPEIIFIHVIHKNKALSGEGGEHGQVD
jgi:hypothetical protein